MKKRKAPLQGNIVKTMKVGNTTIHFCDDCIVKTPEEEEKVIKDFYAAAWRIVDELAARGVPV